MQLGTAVYTYLWECPLDEAIERCATFGFKTLEIMTTPPFLWPDHFGPFERRRLRRHAQDAGVRIFSLNPTFLDLNLVSLNPAIRADSRREITSNIRLAADLGAEAVVVTAGRRHPLIPSPFADAVTLATETLGSCARLAEAAGVVLALENMPAQFIATAQQMIALLEQVNSPSLKICYDVANGHMVENPAEGLRLASPHLALVHYCDTHRQRWGHLPIGMGEVDFAATTGVLREVDYQGPVILETTWAEDPDGGVTTSLRALAELGLRV